MEQAHTQLIAQLNERILAADNTPLYIKFAETVKNAVRSGVLEHGNILPGERDLSQLTGVSRITVRKAMQALERPFNLSSSVRVSIVKPACWVTVVAVLAVTIWISH